MQTDLTPKSDQTFKGISQSIGSFMNSYGLAILPVAILCGCTAVDTTTRQNLTTHTASECNTNTLCDESIFADAGTSKTVVSPAKVILDGSHSFSQNGSPLLFSWKLISTPANSAATISDPENPKPTFFADKPGVYTASLVVNAGHAKSPPSYVFTNALPSSVGPGKIRSLTLDAWTTRRISNAERNGILLDIAKNAGANHITIAYNIVFDRFGNNLDSARTPWNSELATKPTDLLTAIKQIRERQMAIILKPMTSIYDERTSQAFGNVHDYYIKRFQDFDINLFFSGYKARLNEFAALAAEQNIEIFSIGTEADGINGARYDSEWRKIITSIRKIYNGKLTYGASLRPGQYGRSVSDIRTVQFWDALDYIGLSYYPRWRSLSGKFSNHTSFFLFNNVTDCESCQRLSTEKILKPIIAKFKKPLLIEEFAFSAMPDSLQRGYDKSFLSWNLEQLNSVTPDYQNQSVAYSKFFEYFNETFGEDIAGYNAWVLLSQPLIYSNESEYKKWALHQAIAVRNQTGAVEIKPLFSTIKYYFSGETSDNK